VHFKTENKRKSDDHPENSTAKTKRMEMRLKCSDLIVLGLPWKTSEQDLRVYFENFGELLMAQVRFKAVFITPENKKRVHSLTQCLHVDRLRRMQKLARAKVSASYDSPITILKSASFLSGTLSTADGVT
jgi:RNA recognition motif-containing protein